jgi:hypothetical protein
MKVNYLGKEGPTATNVALGPVTVEAEYEVADHIGKALVKSGQFGEVGKEPKARKTPTTKPTRKRK